MVCHEISSQQISSNLADLSDMPCVRILEFKDGIKSPAGPVNFGIRVSTGKYILLVGSDDYLDAGFLVQYLDKLKSKTDLDVLILPKTKVSKDGNTSYSHGPIPQFGLRKRLRPVRDRLLYRAAPIALVKRSLFKLPEAELYTEGVGNGEDVIHSVWLWDKAKAVYFDRNLPHYIECDDAKDRVTTLENPNSEELLQALMKRVWFSGLPAKYKNAFAIKYLRTNILALWRNDLPQEKNLELRLKIHLLSEYSNFKFLSIRERIQVNSILRGNLARYPKSTVQKSDYLRRFVLSLPSNPFGIFSSNSWFSIVTDMLLGDFFHKLSRLRRTHAQSKISIMTRNSGIRR